MPRTATRTDPLGRTKVHTDSFSGTGVVKSGWTGVKGEQRGEHLARWHHGAKLDGAGHLAAHHSTCKWCGEPATLVHGEHHETDFWLHDTGSRACEDAGEFTEACVPAGAPDSWYATVTYAARVKVPDIVLKRITAETSNSEQAAGMVKEWIDNHLMTYFLPDDEWDMGTERPTAYELEADVIASDQLVSDVSRSAQP
jgi:hypothetical protein